jgi:GTP 3',8-cyclase
MNSKITCYIDEVEKIISGKYVQPITVEIDPSNGCNLNCSFCMYKKTNQKNLNIDINIYRSVVEQLYVEGTKSITFTGGGEPTINKNFNEMVEFALSYSFEVGLITNGVLLDRVSNQDKFKFIRVSLNAASPEMYRKITGRDYFEKVIDNMKRSIKEDVFIGWSFVVSEENKHEIELAAEIAKKIDVKYIQFKPAVYHDGDEFNNYQVPHDQDIIDTRRYKAKDSLPCSISHLIGIIGADANVYYCCQYRGEKTFSLGSLKYNSFKEIWQRRFDMFVDVSKCPHCRGMNYAVEYEKMKKSILFDHRHFL